MHDFGEILVCIGIVGTFRQLLLFGAALTVVEFWPEEKKEVYIQGGKLLISVVVILAGYAMCG